MLRGSSTRLDSPDWQKSLKRSVRSTGCFAQKGAVPFFPVNLGVGAARNTAIKITRGQWIAYLDQDDEYYPDYLAQVAQVGQEADVLMFCYDFFCEDGPPRGRPTVWEPKRLRRRLFSINLSTPFGVAQGCPRTAAECFDFPWQPQ
jgi:glycosyltransferase involved in cell wall biosynthesis